MRGYGCPELSFGAPLGGADYYIDDQNFTSLLYSENPGGAKWGPFQEGGETLSISLANVGFMSTADSLFELSAAHSTYAACTVADNCQVQIPFTGSGITIYVLQAGAQGINASLTIDGGAPNYYVLPAPRGPNFYTPNVTLSSIQGITTGNHTATMTVQNWDNIFSGMMFDYAVINQTIVSRTTTSSVTSSTAASTMSNPTTTAAPSSSHSTTNIGAIVGAVVGGLATLVALSLAIFYFRQRRRHEPQRFSANLGAEPKIEPFFSPDSLYHRSTITEQYTGVPELPTTESLVTGPVSAHPPPLSTSSGSSRREKSQLGITNPSTSQLAHANVISTRAGSSSPYIPGLSESSRPRIHQTHSILSDDQADFVNNLYANNVPAGAIARVIERMIAGERQPVVDGYDSLPPPSYHHVARDE
ncbi:hypothetical protein J3R83DRAFT_13988 [Lanmaoa asiatica]|nr:hypothetical protein J3R83DRAFT_13988 [Lanmaoa asiatica]